MLVYQRVHAKSLESDSHILAVELTEPWATWGHRLPMYSAGIVWNQLGSWAALPLGAEKYGIQIIELQLSFTAPWDFYEM